MPSYDIDALIRQHEWIYRVGFTIWETLGDDERGWSESERVVIRCTQFKTNIGNGFSDFIGNVSTSVLFDSMQGLRAVRDNLCTRTAEAVLKTIAEYGVIDTDEATWQQMDEWDTETLEEVDGRVREIDDEFIEQIWDDKGPDSLQEALREYIHAHVDELRCQKE